MKTFIADIFPKIQNYSQKLDDLTILANKHWVSIDNITTTHYRKYQKTNYQNYAGPNKPSKTTFR